MAGSRRVRGGGGADDDTAEALACRMQGPYGVRSVDRGETAQRGRQRLGGSSDADGQWKQSWQTEGPRRLAARSGTRAPADEALKAQVYQQIGPRQGALAWLKQKLDMTGQAKRRLIDPTPTQLSMARQCALLGVPRSRV